MKRRTSPRSTPTLKSLGIAALLTVVFGTAAVAQAESHSLITAGVGTSLGVSHLDPYLGESSSAFSNDFTLRVKGLYVLGLELGVSPTDGGPGSGLVYQNTLRLSGLLYLVPTRWVSVYAKGGIEGDSIGALFSVEDPSNAYHVGGGVDVNIGKHFVVGLEFLVLMPGVESIRRTAEAYIASETARLEEAARAGTSIPEIPTDVPDAGDFISASNFRLSVGVRYYF